MPEKNKIEITPKKIIALVCSIIIIITTIYLFYMNNRKYNGDYQFSRYHGVNSETIRITNEPYIIINHYSDYEKLIEKAEEYGWKGLTYKYDANFFENNSLVFIEILKFGAIYLDTNLISVKECTNSVDIEIYGDASGYTADVSGGLYFIPIPKKITTANVNYVYEYTYQIENIKGIIIILAAVVTIFITLRKKKNKENQNKKLKILKTVGIIIILIILIIVGLFALAIHITNETSIDKPIIYLYPTDDTEVSVKLKYNENITVSYPQYINSWNVFARTDGSLTDLNTNKNLYALYYESKGVVDFKIQNDGFIVKSDNIINFLEEKLDVLGLTEREAEEFIIYWLPILQKNKYNYIRFATNDEINQNMPIEINPNPDTIIRVLMTYKGLDNPIEVEEQKLVTPERTGFVVVEWGGTEIK